MTQAPKSERLEQGKLACRLGYFNTAAIQFRRAWERDGHPQAQFYLVACLMRKANEEARPGHEKLAAAVTKAVGVAAISNGILIKIDAPGGQVESGEAFWRELGPDEVVGL